MDESFNFEKAIKDLLTKAYKSTISKRIKESKAIRKEERNENKYI